MLKAPYIGAAYYPEDWPDEEMDKDIAKMKELGMNVMRIGEFAWHRMEPRPGEFDFSYFHKVIDKLAAAGIGVIMGTPTATPPAWFLKMYPDAALVKANGRPMSHGGRRHCCSNNIHYNEYCMRIVERMAREFADDANIIGWQIDNEIYAWDGGCFCPDCVGKFREHLRKKYGTIDALNEAWNLNLFSQWYDDFTDIPAPRDAWHNPHIKMEWQEFQQQSHIAFIHRQANILHCYVKVPIGTDTMPFGSMNYSDMEEKLDVVQFNHYNTEDNMYRQAFWFDYLRTLKKRPFWNTETQTCWNGSEATVREYTIKPDGFCVANSWMPIALGGEANLYWLWRTHWAGHELVHGAVIDTSGRDMVTTDEVRETAEGFQKAAAFINSTYVAPQLALHFTSHAFNMHDTQAVVQGWSYDETLVDLFHKTMLQKGLRPDVIDENAPLNDYKVLFSPMTMTLEDRGLSEKIVNWVKEGGTWVVGPLTDVRDGVGAKYKDRYYGMLETLTGVKWDFIAPDTRGHIKAQWNDGEPFEGNTWFEICEADADSLVTITEGGKTIVGKSILCAKQVGEGKIILLGTVPSEKDLVKIIELTGIKPTIETSGNVLVAPRKGESMSGTILVEYAAKPAKVTFKKPVTDILTGETLEGEVEMKPYQVIVAKD